MNPDPDILHEIDEHFAAGYFEDPDSSPLRRWSRALRRWFENRHPAPDTGSPLYPAGPKRWPADGEQNRLMQPKASFTYAHDATAAAHMAEQAQGVVKDTILSLRDAMARLGQRLDAWHSPHTVGGRGYTHSIPHYDRVLLEGLDEHDRRVAAGLRAARQSDDAPRTDFYLAMRDVLSGVRTWHAVSVHAVAEWPAASDAAQRRRDRLLKALRRVPFQPARTFYEALVAYNFVFYLDDCDDPGRLDRALWPFYEADLRSGRITRDEALSLLHAFTDNVCANTAWSAAIGGSYVDGSEAYNDVTVLCLEAVRGKFRPNYQLAVRNDMPEAVWDAALEAIASGCGQPALYNDAAFIQSLREADLGVSEEDLVLWNGGGCTETMIHGRSNVGSLDAGINLALILDGTLRRVLATAGGMADIMAAYRDDVTEAVQDIADGVSRLQRSKAEHTPQPMRSLLVDDCIEHGVEFNAGGARYNWSVVNVAGLSNVVDSLAALREVVFDRREIAGGALLEVLDRDFDGDETFRKRLARCPRFGNDEPAADGIAAELAEFVFEEFRRHRPWRGGRFLPSCIMFATYARAGAPVGATPDGRKRGEPLADSIGPVTGRDTNGPTAMLKSVARLPLHLATGTPVLNIRFGKGLFGTDEGRRRVRDLVTTYFAMGGMQIQITVVDQAILRDAIAHPDQHEDLIIRIGGFSAHFNSLSPELKQTLLQRTEHAP